MSENLTVAKRVAWQAPDLNPVLDHHLVVFKKIGEGRQLREVLPPGKLFKRPLLEGASTFVAYAVSRDGNLKHRFSRPGQYVDEEEEHSFFLDITLFFSVADPALLVDKLANDPLSRLADEADAVLSGTAKQLPWEVIRRGGDELERALLGDRRERGRGSAFERLRDFGAALGFDLKHVRIERSLPEAEIKAETHKAESERQERIKDTDAVSAVKDEARKRRIRESEGETLDLEQQIEAAKRAFERGQRLFDTLGENFGRGIGQGTNSVRSFSELGDAVRQMVDIYNSVAALPAGAGLAGPALPGGAAAGTQLLGGGLAPGISPAGRLLTRIFRAVDGLPGDPSERRRALGAALTLVGAALADEDESAEHVEGARRRIDELFARAWEAASVSREQDDLLNLLRDPEALRQEIDGGTDL